MQNKDLFSNKFRVQISVYSFSSFENQIVKNKDTFSQLLLLAHLLSQQWHCVPIVDCDDCPSFRETMKDFETQWTQLHLQRHLQQFRATLWPYNCAHSHNCAHSPSWRCWNNGNYRLATCSSEYCPLGTRHRRSTHPRINHLWPQDPPSIRAIKPPTQPVPISRIVHYSQTHKSNPKCTTCFGSPQHIPPNPPTLAAWLALEQSIWIEKHPPVNCLVCHNFAPVCPGIVFSPENHPFCNSHPETRFAPNLHKSSPLVLVCSKLGRV